MIKGLLLLLLSMIFSPLVGSAATLTGKAVSCELGQPSPLQVSVLVFDAKRDRGLVDLAKALHREDDPTGALFPRRFAEAMDAVRKATALAKATDRTGTFRVNIPDGHDLLVWAYAEVEDHPYFYDYRLISIADQSKPITLDFGRFCSSGK